MIFVFLDDGTLDVISDTSNLCGAYEGIDAQNREYAFFNEHLNKMIPEFHTPNQKGALGVVSGRYVLRAAEIDKAAFLSRLTKVTHINSNEWFKTKKEIEEHVEKAP
jgi:hypothetical protein